MERKLSKMCGICGYFTHRKVEDSVIDKMNSTMLHRGPDIQQTCKFMVGKEYGAVGHCRLSILDLSPKGNQPMWSHDGDYCIVLNGEIYNFNEIKNELQIKGYLFDSATDTEVALYSYIEWGSKCVERLGGMFAFAIFDIQKQTIFLARDRFGKKPLYYYYEDDTLIFASELKPLLCFPGIRKQLNYFSMGYYMRNGYFPEPASVMKFIHKVPSGSYMILRNDVLTIKNYWSPVKAAHIYGKEMVRDYKLAKRLLKKQLEQAVKKRMIADVPLGVFLSSGIDSSVVAAMAQRVADVSINTYTIGFDVPEYNEADIAKKISEELGTKHHEHYVSENDLWSIIDDIPHYFDEPFGDTSMLPSMILARFARNDITVALSGDGGDEIFGGYAHYSKVRVAQKIDWIGGIIYSFLPEIILKKLPESVQRVVENRNPQISSQIILRNELSFFEELFIYPYQEPYFACEQEMDIKDWQLRRMLLDMETTLPGDMLHKVDRASMSASLEVRSPLLDHKVAELALRFPQRFKINGKIRKYILREIAYEYIPKRLLDTPKRGFSIPYQHWMRSGLKERLTDYSSIDYLRKQDIFNPLKCQNMIKVFLNGDNSIANVCWNFLMYQMWYERYMRS